MDEPKGVGQGKGRFTRKGVQLAQATDIEGLKAGLADVIAELESFSAWVLDRLDKLEAAGGTPPA